jgi:hypothetical protein
MQALASVMSATRSATCILIPSLQTGDRDEAALYERMRARRKPMTAHTTVDR